MRGTELERRLAARPMPGVPAFTAGRRCVHGQNANAIRPPYPERARMCPVGQRVHHVSPTASGAVLGRCGRRRAPPPQPNHRLHGAQRGPAHRRTLTALAGSSFSRATTTSPVVMGGARKGPPFVSSERGASWLNRDTASRTPSLLYYYIEAGYRPSSRGGLWYERLPGRQTGEA